ncbi:Uncharacterized membrane protein YkoI [Enhydrobacter aerosaccus]|uniref:Uncharacterized membrane protein YkoI n=2 Tax=Enhydrobacter aerosaccus TaxID=225324 RepID=A0A1T4SBL6_9HYPH|nr:Uncharacterized membrane protein YkoI [Enhydrobacter aerosaccus]
MYRSKLTMAAMATVIALGAAGTAFAETGEHEDNKEVGVVLGAKTAPSQAIATAEQKTGGRAVRIDVEKENGVYLYEIKTMTPDKVANVFVDLVSGQVVRVDNEGPITKLLDRDDKDELARLAAAPTTLPAAIAAAEQHVGGKAIEASFDDENGTILYKVAVAKDSIVHHLTVDSTTGKITKAAVGEDGEHGEHED